MAQDHQAQPTPGNDSQPSTANRYIKEIFLRLAFYSLIACAAYYSVKHFLNPQDNFVVIINNRNEGLSAPLVIRLQEGDDTFWTVSCSTGINGGRARAYLIPHPIFHGNLILESIDANYSCKISPNGRHRNTIFISLDDHECACSINKTHE
jgi:hypothetical protein